MCRSWTLRGRLLNRVTPILRCDDKSDTREMDCNSTPSGLDQPLPRWSHVLLCDVAGHVAYNIVRRT